MTIWCVACDWNHDWFSYCNIAVPGSPSKYESCYSHAEVFFLFGDEEGFPVASCEKHSKFMGFRGDPKISKEEYLVAKVMHS